MVLSDPPLVLPAESCVLLLPPLPELLPESPLLLLPPVAQLHTISMCMAARSKTVEQDLHATNSATRRPLVYCATNRAALVS